MPSRLTEEQSHTNFNHYARSQTAWGTFLRQSPATEIMVSTVNLNSRTQQTAQIGGVYTAEEHRRKGYQQLALRLLLSDCYKLHGMRKAVLFTAEGASAHKLYEKLGFVVIGDYGMFFK